MRLLKVLAWALGHCFETLQWGGIVGVPLLSGTHQTKQKEDSAWPLRRPKECYLDLLEAQDSSYR